MTDERLEYTGKPVRDVGKSKSKTGIILGSIGLSFYLLIPLVSFLAIKSAENQTDNWGAGFAIIPIAIIGCIIAFILGVVAICFSISGVKKLGKEGQKRTAGFVGLALGIIAVLPVVTSPAPRTTTPLST